MFEAEAEIEELDGLLDRPGQQKTQTRHTSVADT
jgi:hypothetical protein